MNTVSEPASSSLAQRIVKVRNCILVEVSTGVSPSDKDLFASLCQTYEQDNVGTSRTVSTSSQNTLDQASSLSDLAPESILPRELTTVLGRDTPPRQRRIGFSVVRWSDFEGFDDWDKWSDQ